MKTKIFKFIPTILLLLGLELGFRLFGYDFDRQKSALEQIPIYSQIPTIPFGTVYFRRPGPAEWTGQVLNTSIGDLKKIDQTYEHEPVLTIKYDENGFRNPAVLKEWEIAVTGDSFVELGYLPYEDLFTTQLARYINRPVKNLGVSKTGPFTYAAYLEHFGKSPRTKHAIMIFYEENDPGDAFEEYARQKTYEETGIRPLREIKKQSSFFLAIWKGVQHLGQKPPVPVSMKTAVFIGPNGEIPISATHPLPRLYKFSEDELAIIELSLKEWAELCRQLKIQPWLAYMPTKFHAMHKRIRFYEGNLPWKEPDFAPFIEKLCKKHGISFVDLTDSLSAASKEGELVYNTIADTHLNKKGCEVVAQSLGKALLKSEATIHRSK